MRPLCKIPAGSFYFQLAQKLVAWANITPKYTLDPQNQRIRIYRGLHKSFTRDKNTLIGRTQRSFFVDNAFPHNCSYFYAVRAVDFAGQEGEDNGARIASVGAIK